MGAVAIGKYVSVVTKSTGRSSAPSAGDVALAGERSLSSCSDAAEEAVARNVTSLRLPLFGTVKLPPVDHLVWYGGVAVLTAVELIEWPVSLVLVVGRIMADNRSHRTLRALGEALEESG